MGLVTRRDLASLEKLGAWGIRITDLKGLEFATNLTRLHLSANKITDDQKTSSTKPCRIA